MIRDAELDEILRLEAITLPASPRVVGIKHSAYIDSEGRDALLIWVILHNATKASQRRWKQLEPVERAIRDALGKAQVDLWPYFKYRTRSEFNKERTKV